MKKIITSIVVCIVACQMAVFAAPQFNLGSLLGGGSGSGSNAGNTLGNILGGVLDELTSTSDFTVQDIVGTWNYAAPAVDLEGTNVLQNLGGSAATSMMEEKLEPYYKKFGIDKVVITINPDETFEMTLPVGKASGKVEMSPEDGLVFNFQAFKQANIGKVKAQATKTATGLVLTFDISKLKDVLTKVAAASGNANLNSLSSMLSAYEGLYAGFKLTKAN